MAPSRGAARFRFPGVKFLRLLHGQQGAGGVLLVDELHLPRWPSLLLKVGTLLVV